MAFPKLSSVLTALALFAHSQALQLPPKLSRRTASRRDSHSIGSANIIFTNERQDQFYTTVYVDDTPYAAIIDLASSDLFLSGNVTNAQHSVSNASVSWEGQNVQGSITKGKVGVAGVNLTANNYFYTTTDLPGLNYSITANGALAKIGLGNTNHSQLSAQTNDGTSSIIDTIIYESYPDERYLTILIAPDEVTKGKGAVPAGFWSIGSVLDWTSLFDLTAQEAERFGLPDLSLVKNQTFLDVTDDGTFLIDGIQVAGSTVALNSSVEGTSQGHAVARLSTTESPIIVDKSTVDAIYGSVPGSSWSEDERVYYLPCTTELNVTILIGGSSFTINPLDIVGTVLGSSTCVGQFKASNGSSQGYDVLLGTTFLQNVYTLYGYQTLTNGKTLSLPYLQFLSITDPSEVHDQFAQFRTGGTTGPSSSQVGSSPSSISVPSVSSNRPSSTAGSSSGSEVPPTPAPSSVGGANPSPPASLSTPVVSTPSVATPSPVNASGKNPSVDLSGNLSSDDSSDDHNLPSGSIANQLKHCLPAIIVLAVVAGLLSVGLIVFCLVRKRRSNHRSAPSAYRSLHLAESAEPAARVPLYGAEDDGNRYGDRYTDEK